MKSMLKKYWYIGLITAILLVFLGLFVYNESSGKLRGKTVDGKEIVAMFNNQNISADQVYDKSKESTGTRVITMLLVKNMLDQAVPTTPEIKEKVQKSKTALVENYKAKNPKGYEQQIGDAIRELGFTKGFSDLEDYLTITVKNQILIENYIKENANTYFEKIDEQKGRTVSHILVKYPELTNEEKKGKTKEEIAKLQETKNAENESKMKAKMEEIDNALKSSSFADVAAKYSDDTATKSTKGSLGYITSKTSFVKEFLDAALALKKDEVSGWVKTTYGYHKIKADVVGKDELLKDEAVKAKIIETIIKQDNTLYKKAAAKAFEQYPVETSDKDVQKALDAIIK